MFASLLLASALWLGHNLSLRYSGTISIPVVAESNIPGHFTTSEYPVVISARCRANGYSMLIGGRRAVRVEIAPEDFHRSEGDYFSISANELSRYTEKIFGPGVSLESFSASSYKFKFGVENNKTVPVLAVNSISLGDEYARVGGIQLQPDSVIVYGDPHTIESVHRINTESLTLSGITSSKHGTLKLVAPKGTRLSESQVHYTLHVTRCVEMKKKVKVDVRNVPDDRTLMVFPSTAEVTFLCPFPMDEDPSGSIRLYIDYEEFVLSLNGRCVARTEELPENILSYEIEPQIFECFETSAE